MVINTDIFATVVSKKRTYCNIMKCVLLGIGDSDIAVFAVYLYGHIDH